MNSLRFTLIALALFGASLMVDATIIQNKLNGGVLTIVEERVPPGGPYERRGVIVSPYANSEEQQWDLEQSPNLKYHLIYPKNRALTSNSITLAVPEENAAAYFRVYDRSEITANKYGLLKSIDAKFPTVCIKSPERYGDFHLEVPCDQNDPAQLWRFID